MAHGPQARSKKVEFNINVIFLFIKGSITLILYMTLSNMQVWGRNETCEVDYQSFWYLLILAMNVLFDSVLVYTLTQLVKAVCA